MFQVLVAEDELWIRDAVVEMVEKLNRNLVLLERQVMAKRHGTLSTSIGLVL